MSARPVWNRAWPFAAPLAWSVFVSWRAPEWGILHGLPLTPLSIGVLAAIWWSWAIRRRVPGGRWIALLLLLKIVAGPWLAPRGLHAGYFASDSWQGRPERGLYASLPDTRIDATLAFGEGRADLPVFFLNGEAFRRNASRQPVSVEWSGYLLIPDESLTLYLTGDEVSGGVSFDGVPVLVLDAASRRAEATIAPRPGWMRLVVRAASATGFPRAFEAGVRDPRSGVGGPFSRADVFQARRSGAELLIDRLLRPFSVLVDLGALALLALAFGSAVRLVVAEAPARGWESTVIRLLPIVACLDAFVVAQPAWDRTELLAYGSDRRTYEAYARDILFHGPLMTLGARVGEGAPFYFQPLYPYFLAAVHRVTGEGFWGAYFLQRLGFWFVFYALWRTAAALFDRPTTLAAIGVAGWFVFVRLDGYSRTLYNESLFLPLISGSMLWHVREAAGPGTQRLAAGALWGGLASLARSTWLAGLLPAGLLLAASYRRHRRPRGRLVLYGVLVLALISTATVRNGIVARRFVAIASSGAVNLALGNAPPPEVVDLPAHAHWLADRFVPASSRAVFEYAYHAPKAFAGGLWAKAAYALGVESMFGVRRPRQYLTTVPIHWTLAWVGLCACIGLLLMRTRPSAPLRFARLVPAAMAVSQLAAIVLIFPYSERLVVPFYTLLAVYAAVPFGIALRRLRTDG